MSDTTLPAGGRSPLVADDWEGPFRPGTRVGGRYTIEERIGTGGMGIVYRARQDLTDKRVALKVLRSARGDGLMLDRFLDEIRLLGRLDHHGLASIHDADLHARSEGGDVLFFTMDLVEGVPITTWAEQRNPDRRARIALIARVCEAMQYAHDHGVIHCDLKPANILVRRSGEPVVIDFGLAYMRDMTDGDPSPAELPETLGGLGRGFAGTPSYMSPEQFQGGVHELRAGQSVDVYALGVVAFELLTGRLPYDLPAAPDLSDLRRAVLFSSARHLVEFLPDIDPELDRVIAKALRKDPADRFFSVAQFLRALSRFLPSAAPTPDDVWRPAVGQTIPATNWILDEKLGEGGVGEVWTCHHRSLKNKRIVKFCADEEKASFLRRELTLYKLLKEKVGQNPHFARLEEVALEEPPRYLMSEFIEASDFSKWCAVHRARAPIPEATLLEIVAQAADALQAAHDAGVIHRDVKPSNLLLRGEPDDPASVHVWVGDFGIGQVISEELLGDGTRGGFTRTLLGKALSSYSGTHLYMAPELLSGGDASVRSDIYALGVVLYQALAGDFQRTLTIDWAADIPDPLLRADLEKCFARDPAARFPSAAQLADHLRRLPDRRRQRERAEMESALRERRAYRRGVARTSGVAAAIIALISGLAWFGFHKSQVATKQSIIAEEQSAIAKEQSIIAKRERAAAVIGEATALRKSQTPGKRAAALERVTSSARDNLPDSDEFRGRLKREAVAVLALPAMGSAPIHSLESAQPIWVSPGLSAAAVQTGDRTFSLHRRQDERWEQLRALPPLPSTPSKLFVSDAGEAIGALLSDGTSVALNFQGEWRSVTEASSGCLAVADPGIAAVPRPDGTIEIFRAGHPEGPAVVLGRDRAGGDSKAPPAQTAVEWPRARPAKSLAFDPAGRRLAVASGESQFLMVWEVESGRLEAAAEHLHSVSSVAWNPEAPRPTAGRRTPESERLLATGAEDGTAAVWDLDRRQGPASSPDHLFLVPTRRFLPPTPQKVAVRQVAFAAAGRNLLVLYDNHALALFDCQSGDFIDFIPVPSNAAGLAASRDGRLALHGTDQKVTFSFMGTRPVFHESKVFYGKVTDVDSDTDGRLSLARGTEGAVLIDSLRLRTLHRFNQAFGHTGRFNPENDALLAIGGGRILMWERTTDEADPRTILFTGPPDTGPGDFVEMDVISLRPGVRVGVVSKEGTLTIKRSDSKAAVEIEALTTGSIRRQRLHPGGEWIAVIGNEPSPPRIVSVKDKSSNPLPVAAANFLDVAFSPDGRFLALRDASAVHILSAPAWIPLPPIKLPSRLTTEAPIAFSHDSSVLLASGPDGVPVLYRVPAVGTTPWTVAAHLEGPQIRDATSARFGCPGRCCLLIGTADGYFQTWNITELRRALRPLGLDWGGPEWPWPENPIPWEAVKVTPEPEPPQ